MDDQISITFHVTEDCQLNCSYCSNEQRIKNSLSLEEVKSMLLEISEEFPSHLINIKWIGGEPTLLGREFYRDIQNFQNDSIFNNNSFYNLMCTHLAYGLSPWIDLYTTKNWHVATSLDELESNRSIRSGSSKKVRRNLETLVSHGASVDVRSTITKHNVDQLQDLYHYHQNLGIDWDFALVIPSGIGTLSAKASLPNPDVFSSFVIGIYDEWVNSNDSTIEIPVLGNLIEQAVMQNTGIANEGKRFELTYGPSTSPFSDYPVFYTCPVLVGNTSEVLGSTLKDGLKASCASKNKTVPEACNSCLLKSGCHCYYADSVRSEERVDDFFCKSWKSVANHIKQDVFSQLSQISN